MRRNQGVLSRAARGEGVICPKCKTYAPLLPGGNCVCTSCGCVIAKVAVGAVEAAAPKKKVARGKTTVPSQNLGTNRSALLEAANEPATPAPAPAAPVAPARVVTPPPKIVEDVVEDDE